MSVTFDKASMPTPFEQTSGTRVYNFEDLKPHSALFEGTVPKGLIVNYLTIARSVSAQDLNRRKLVALLGTVTFDSSPDGVQAIPILLPTGEFVIAYYKDNEVPSPQIVIGMVLSKKAEGQVIKLTDVIENA